MTLIDTVVIVVSVFFSDGSETYVEFTSDYFVQTMILADTQSASYDLAIDYYDFRERTIYSRGGNESGMNSEVSEKSFDKEVANRKLLEAYDQEQKERRDRLINRHEIIVDSTRIFCDLFPLIETMEGVYYSIIMPELEEIYSEETGLYHPFGDNFEVNIGFGLCIDDSAAAVPTHVTKSRSLDFTPRVQELKSRIQSMHENKIPFAETRGLTVKKK